MKAKTIRTLLVVATAALLAARADKPSGGPDWGLRFTMTFVFPR